VRPDVAAFIASKKTSDVQQKAMIQFAQALQGALEAEVSDPQAVASSARAITRGVGCIWRQFSASEAPDIVTAIRSRTMNTKERVLAYERYAHALSGSVLRRPGGNPCD